MTDDTPALGGAGRAGADPRAEDGHDSEAKKTRSRAARASRSRSIAARTYVEAHLLQPQVVGRVIRLHPLAVILALAVGAVLAGIPGAVVAVPVVAVITRAVPEPRQRQPGDLGPDDP